MKEKWTLPQVVLLAIVAFLFGGIFMGADALYTALLALLTPLGYAPFANEILFGLWTMAAPVAAMLIPRPGSAILGEVFAALAEMLYGSYFGAGAVLSGFIQGLGTEAGFAVTRYKRYDAFSLFLAAIGTTVFSFIYEFFKFGYGTYGIGMIIALFVVRLVSVSFFGIVLAGEVSKLYQRVVKIKALHP